MICNSISLAVLSIAVLSQVYSLNSYVFLSHILDYHVLYWASGLEYNFWFNYKWTTKNNGSNVCWLPTLPKQCECCALIILFILFLIQLDH